MVGLDLVIRPLNSGVGIGGVRVSSTNNVGINFINVQSATWLTPTAGTYRVNATRRVKPGAGPGTTEVTRYEVTRLADGSQERKVIRPSGATATVVNYIGVAVPNFMLALVLMWVAFAWFGIGEWQARLNLAETNFRQSDREAAYYKKLLQQQLEESRALAQRGILGRGDLFTQRIGDISDNGFTVNCEKIREVWPE